MTQHRGETFEGGVIRGDENEFIECKFRNCTIMMGSAGLPTMTDCLFDNVTWDFSERAADPTPRTLGSGAATFDFLQAAYRRTDELKAARRAAES